jgi:hypothetical protein
VSVVFYPTRDYLPLVEFGVLRRAGSLKLLIFGDEQVDAVAETLRTLWKTCVVGSRGMQVREWCLPAGCDTQSANNPSVRRLTVHSSDFAGYRIFIAHV